MWSQFLAVAIGGAFGSSLRFAVGRALTPSGAGIPWGTVAVNLLGCLLIGLLVGWSEQNGGLGDNLRALAVAGFLGGFTTFSAFGLETVVLAREAGTAPSLAYFSLQIVGGLLLVVLGLFVGRTGW